MSFSKRTQGEVDQVTTNAQNDNFVLGISDSLAKSQNENLLKDKNLNFNNATANVNNSGNAVVNVFVDADSIAKNRSRALAGADAAAVDINA